MVYLQPEIIRPGQTSPPRSEGVPSVKVVGRKQEARRTMRKGRMSQRERAIQEPDCHGSQRKSPVGRGRGSRGCSGGGCEPPEPTPGHTGVHF